MKVEKVIGINNSNNSCYMLNNQKCSNTMLVSFREILKCSEEKNDQIKGKKGKGITFYLV